jgi:hypothetical protein
MSVSSRSVMRGETELYAHLQGAVPAGARLAVLVDEPYHLDYARNPVFNLDMPGFASPAPGQPFFQGSERVAEYFRGQSIRYLAFVRAEMSRYHYRRDYWIERLLDDQELWRRWAPYLLDFIDNLAELARTHGVIFEERGLVVVDLEAPHAP